MQAFTAIVHPMLQGRRVPPEKITVTAENETRASYLAEIEAREKWPGCVPLIKGIRPADCPHEQKYERPPEKEGEAPKDAVHAETADKTEGLRDYDRPSPKPYAEWRAMPWFSLRKYALHAIKGTSAPEPKTKTDALVILEERGLVKP
jgi:hypothetical protein